MDAYKITDAQMDVLYQVKTALQATSLIGECAGAGGNHEFTPLVELFGQLAARMGKVLVEAELLPDPVKKAAAVRVI